MTTGAEVGSAMELGEITPAGARGDDEISGEEKNREAQQAKMTRKLDHTDTARCPAVPRASRT